MKALEGVMARAQEEYRDYDAAGPTSKKPKDMFCQGYLFGVAFGLGLSAVRPDLVRKFEPIFRERGWLKEHEQFNSRN